MSEQSYLDALCTVHEYGELRTDRTSVGSSYVVSGLPISFNLQSGFPILTTKKLWWQGAFHELFWLLSGKTDIQYLHDNKVRYWDNWAIDGDVGPTYGFQWRHFGALEGGPPMLGDDAFGIDQLQQCIDNLKAGPPYSRRNIVTAWNPRDLQRMEPGQLPPCHILYQFVAVEDEDHPDMPAALDLVMYQRSCDMFLGVPFDIVLYALLLELVAHSVGMEPRQLSIMLADAHIYSNHMDAVKEQLDRDPMVPPELGFHCDPKPIDDYEFEDLVVIGYEHHPAIRGDVAI